MRYLITYGILIAVAIIICRRERRRFEREAAREAAQFDADYQAGLAAGGRDRLDALIEATREHQHLAWGPDADEPVPYYLTEDELWAASRDMWEAELAEGSGL